MGRRIPVPAVKSIAADYIYVQIGARIALGSKWHGKFLPSHATIAFSGRRTPNGYRQLPAPYLLRTSTCLSTNMEIPPKKGACYQH